MEVGQNLVKLTRSKLDMGPGGYSLTAFTEATQQEIRAGYAAQNLETRTSQLATGTTTWEAPKDYKGGHYDHFYTFFQAIRGQGSIVQDPTFGLRAAGAALLANESYYQRKPVSWDPVAMRLV